MQCDKRPLWIEQARRLREEQPELWHEAIVETVGMANAAAGDAVADEPWEELR